MKQFIVAGAQLVGDVEIESLCAGLTRDFTIKGMFFAPYVRALNGDWPALSARLLAPPKDGRYVAFSDYPTADFLRIFDRVARRTHAGVSPREAYRLLARREVETFFDSTLGRVASNLVTDPASAVLQYPRVFGVLARGPSATAERTGPRSVGLTFESYRGSFEYVVGVLEGLVMTFREVPSLVVWRKPDFRYECEVRW